MKNNIELLEIKNLWGQRNLSIPIEENQLVLVGENGSGKSTVVAILYYLITKQWHKLRKYQFSQVSITIDGKKTVVNRDEISSYFNPRMSSKSMTLVYSKMRELDLDPEYIYPNMPKSLYDAVNRELRITPSRLRSILREIKDSEGQLTILDEANDIFSELDNAFDLNVIYLPTYRRIERDLKTIFPDLEEDVRRFKKIRSRKTSSQKYIELVEFGMEDVFYMINETMSYLKDSFRTSLGTLTSGYLRVILRKEYENANFDALTDFDPSDLDSILSKIDVSVLSEQDRKSLRGKIQDLNIRKPDTDLDKISAHIITELILLHKNQYEKEQTVRTFTEVCNKYLQSKKFVYDSSGFTLPIKCARGDSNSDSNDILLNMLSSGEKQIVSLFAHLYLSDLNDFLLIIDEPELSLSVPWQEAFLPDILSSHRCAGLIAVTHSPFIYNNDLKSKAHAIQEYMED